MQIRKAELTDRRGLSLMILAMALGFLTACATTGSVNRQPVIRDEPSLARLKDGRQGFVIRETPGLDADGRAEFEKAISLIKEGNNDKAIEILTGVIERYPGLTPPRIDIAEAYQRAGRTDLAEQQLKTALTLVPGHPVASNVYGLLLRRSGRFQEARTVYETSLARFPEYLPIHRNLGILCDLYLNDPSCALKQFETCSEARPGDEKVRIWIAELRMRAGQ